MKPQRHAAILKIVQRQTVASQEQLRELLKGEGYDVTQATLSRDIGELGLAKVASPDGGCDLLAVVQTASREGSTVHPRSLAGPALRFLPDPGT